MFSLVLLSAISANIPHAAILPQETKPVAAAPAESGAHAVAPAPPVPNIGLVSIGGTLVSKAKGRFTYQTYVKEHAPIQEIVSRLKPDIDAIANLSLIEARELDSHDIDAPFLRDLTIRIDKVLARPDVDGIVVTAGTNVLEEIAYWLDLTVRSDKPVVVTGSMRQSNTASWDGEANLFNAVRLAASRKTTCFGTVVMLDDEFFGAREVTKTDAVRMDTFQARRTGTLGYVDEYRIRAIHAPARVLRCHKPDWQTPFDMTRTPVTAIPRVDIVYSYVDAGGEPIAALAAAGVKGIVAAGSGAGDISKAQLQAQKAAIANGVIFVTASRTGSGSVYDIAPGILPAGDLLPQKARILLQLGLSQGAGYDQLKAWFMTLGRPDFDFSGSPQRPQ